MSWFDIFAGHVIFGSARVCDLAPAALDWQITANVPVYFETFPDSNCVVQPSQVWTSWACLSKTTNRESWNQGCDPNKTPIGFDFKFQQRYNAGLDLNFTVTTTVDCTKATVFHDGTGLNFLYECYSTGAKCKDACGSSSTSSLSTTKTSSSSRSSPTVSCSSTSTRSASSSTITKSGSTITASCPSESTQPRTSSSTPPVTSTSSTTVTQPPKTASSPPTTTFNPPKTTSNPPKAISNPPTTTFNPPKNTTSSNPPVSSRPVTAGSSSLHAPRTLLWAILLFFLCLFTPDVLGFIPPAAAEPLPAVPRSPLHPEPLAKRLSPTKISDLQAMLQPVFATIEHNLPAKPGAPASNALRATANSLVASMCAAGKTQRQLYGADWIAKGNLSKPGNAKPDPAVDGPHTRPLTQLMALCVRAVDGMDKGLGAFYTQQQLLDNSAWPSGPSGVLYMKYVGVLYCNRLVVALQQGGDAELDGICGLHF